MLKVTFLVFAVVIAIDAATPIKKCTDEKSFDRIGTVSITNCTKLPCHLKKNRTVVIEETFVPQRDLKNLITSVHAIIAGLPFPFIGVDGEDACPNIYSKDGVKVGCPLSKGTEYVYKNEFPILSIYPRIALVVTWALKNSGEDITCFQAPSKIIK